MELENAGLSWCSAYPHNTLQHVCGQGLAFFYLLLVDMHVSLRCVLLAGRIMQSGSVAEVSGYAYHYGVLGQTYCHTVMSCHLDILTSVYEGVAARSSSVRSAVCGCGI